MADLFATEVAALLNIPTPQQRSLTWQLDVEYSAVVRAFDRIDASRPEHLRGHYRRMTDLPLLLLIEFCPGVHMNHLDAVHFDVNNAWTKKMVLELGALKFHHS